MNDYITMDNIYNVLNEKLFLGILPSCIITLQRKQNCFGYFHPNKFEEKGNIKNIKDEIALNPDHFEREDVVIFATIAHEMVHLWQYHFGLRKSRSAYHNKEWANKMEEIGLIPSNTGIEGGKKTGQKMTHYINENGLFLKVILELKNLYKIEWKSKVDFREKIIDRTRWRCLECGLIARAKSSANLVCGNCSMKMENI